MKSFLVYSGLRVLLLIVVGGFAWALGMRGLLLIAAAFLISGLLSYFLLSDQRSRFGISVGGFFHRINERIDAAAAAEDPVDEPAGQPIDLRGERLAKPE